jgi:cation:H+ antiporter
MGLIGSSVGHLDGAILIVAFVIFLGSMLMAAKKHRTTAAEIAEEEAENEIVDIPTWLCIIYIIGGAVAIKFGGDWVVDSCTTLALKFGMSETLVGLTIVALGTSLPELVTSIVAAKKNELDMAIGNVVGSNVFNILLILGTAGAISPMTYLTVNAIDTLILVAFSAVVWLMCLKKKNLNRANGIIMLLLYVAYLAYIIVRDGGVA